MRDTNNHSLISALQLQIKIEKQVFDEAIRNDKEFSEIKKNYLELKELEKELGNCIERSQKQYN
jgi:hypothetical protein